MEMACLSCIPTAHETPLKIIVALTINYPPNTKFCTLPYSLSGILFSTLFISPLISSNSINFASTSAVKEAANVFNSEISLLSLMLFTISLMDSSTWFDLTTLSKPKR